MKISRGWPGVCRSRALLPKPFVNAEAMRSRSREWKQWVLLSTSQRIYWHWSRRIRKEQKTKRKKKNRGFDLTRVAHSIPENPLKMKKRKKVNEIENLWKEGEGVRMSSSCSIRHGVSLKAKKTKRNLMPVVVSQLVQHNYKDPNKRSK